MVAAGGEKFAPAANPFRFLLSVGKAFELWHE
jgi:hypothetical protein